MQILQPPWPKHPEEIITIRINKRISSEEHGRGGFYQVKEYQEIKIIEAKLEDVFDLILKSLKEASKCPVSKTNLPNS